MRERKYMFDESTVRYRHHLKVITKFLKKHIFLIVAAMAMWCFFYSLMNSWSGAYLDSDGYMRALRVYHFVLNPTFWEQPIYESNYPFGEILHWTRPMDIIWLLFTLPFSYMDNLRDVIFISGAFIAPMTGVLMVIALAYGLRRIFNIYLVLIGCCLFLLDPLVLISIDASRPDHHALMLLLSIYAFSLTLCWLKKRQNRYLCLMGVTLALSAFTAIEGMILYAAFLIFFLYLYVFKNVSLLPVVKIAKYFALSLMCFWLLNPPYQGLFYPDNGRISILFVVASWLAFFGFKILNASRLHTAKIKLLCLWSMAMGFLLALVVLFGVNVLTSPLSGKIQGAFVDRISEMIMFYNLPWQHILTCWFYPYIALIINIHMLKFPRYKRLMMLNLCVGGIFVALSLVAFRFIFYEPLYTVLPFLALIDHVYRKSAYAKRESSRFPFRIYGIILALFMLQTIIPVVYVIAPLDDEEPATFNSATCQQIKKTGGTLITDIFYSSQYVWECDVNTVATPYHRNKEGIVDAHQLLYAQTVSEIIPLILKHQVTQILLFTDYDSLYYSLDEKNKNRLYYRLLKEENVPPFLEKVPSFLPNARLYKIKDL